MAMAATMTTMAADRVIYFLPVRNHLGEAELKSAFAAQGRGRGRVGGGDSCNAEVIVAKAAEVGEETMHKLTNSAVVIILTYADFDMDAAVKVVAQLPKVNGGVFALVMQVPEGAPFLPTLRARADDLQTANKQKNDLMLMEFPAAATGEHYKEAATTLNEIVFTPPTPTPDHNHNPNDTPDGLPNPNHQKDDSMENDNDENGETTTTADTRTPAEVVRAVHESVKDVL